MDYTSRLAVVNKAIVHFNKVERNLWSKHKQGNTVHVSRLLLSKPNIKVWKSDYLMHDVNEWLHWTG
jgi:hypothetical protein